MEYDVARFLTKKQISPEKILYITRESRRTVIYLTDGESVSSAIPLKTLAAQLPAADFISVSKGVCVRRTQIVDISNDGVYTMTDGRAFQGRKRYLSAHRKMRKAMQLAASAPCAPSGVMGLLEKCSLLDELPLAFCVIELVFDKDGHGLDFVFRYCNKEMEAVEGTAIETMLDHSFYEVFKNGDKKWLVAYADVALNGVKRVIHDFSPEIGRMLTIHCYQPSPGYCGCIVIPDP